MADQFVQFTPISQVCIVVRVQAPAAVTAGMQHVVVLSATYQATIQAGIVLAGNSNGMTNTTLVGTASLQMHKQVRKVSNCSVNAVGLETFAEQNQAKNGDFLEYEITYTNASTRNISQLRVRDVVTSIVQFETMRCNSTPADANCTIETQPAVGGQGEVSWLITGTLKPATQGNVRFCVVVMPLTEGSLR